MLLPEPLRARIAAYHRSLGWSGLAPLCVAAMPEAWPEVRFLLTFQLPPDLPLLALPRDPAWLLLANMRVREVDRRWLAAVLVGTRLVADLVALDELQKAGGPHAHPAALAFAADLIAPGWAIRGLLEREPGASPESVASHFGLHPAEARWCLERAEIFSET